MLSTKSTRGCRLARQSRLSLVMYKQSYKAYLQDGPVEIPPVQNKSATSRIRQQGLTLRLKVLSFPPQQHKNRIMSNIQVQLQPPKVIPPPQPPPQPLFSPYPPSLNIPLNIFTSIRRVHRLSYLTLIVCCTIWFLQKKCYDVVVWFDNYF